MKNKTFLSFAYTPLTAALIFVAFCHLRAQTFNNVYDFTSLIFNANNDGAKPDADLVVAGDTIYGTTRSGGFYGQGTVFSISTNGLGFNTLYPFNSLDGIPKALVLSGSTLFGVTVNGGPNHNGTIFAVHVDGTGFTNLYTFTSLLSQTNYDGAYPNDGLIIAGDTLYGTTTSGGVNGVGTVFSIITNGTSFNTLHSFPDPNYTVGNDGSAPSVGLALSGNTLFGTTWGGGSSGDGTIFSLNTDGTGFTNLYNFSDNSEAQAGTLIVSGSVLYGTEAYGGANGYGTVFAIGTGGSNFKYLYTFTGGNDGYGAGDLVLGNNVLYGTGTQGGANGNGDIFAIELNGLAFTNLYSFSSTFGTLNINSDGAIPVGNLILSGNVLYGKTVSGGTSGNGTLFSLSLPTQTPPIILVPNGISIGGGSSNFTFQASGPIGSNVVLQASTDLFHWSSISTSTIPTIGSLNFTNSTIGQIRRFFRVALP